MYRWYVFVGVGAMETETAAAAAAIIIMRCKTPSLDLCTAKTHKIRIENSRFDVMKGICNRNKNV
jgi:hypothetical protein